MGHIVEKEWQTKAGLKAVCLIITMGDNGTGNKRHRCGYVAVVKDSPLWGKNYSEQLDCITKESVESISIGKKSPLLAFTAGVNSDEEGCIRRSLDIVIDVHGGLTFSGKLKNQDESLWWFGFDCGHYCDGIIEPLFEFEIESNQEVRSFEYVEAECESMAMQIANLLAGKVPQNETN